MGVGGFAVCNTDISKTMERYFWGRSFPNFLKVLKNIEDPSPAFFGCSADRQTNKSRQKHNHNSLGFLYSVFAIIAIRSYGVAQKSGKMATQKRFTIILLLITSSNTIYVQSSITFRNQ